MSQRIVCWFSCGAASAVATKLAIEENLKSESPKELIVASIFLKNEHPDSERFKNECAKWFGQPILDLKNEKYNADVDTVIQKTRYMSGVRGARCTKELKKQVRLDWQKSDDIHVFGMTSEEESRIDNLIDSEPELELWAPLIDRGYTKPDCFKVLNDVGIELPEMYKLGYHNNNCIGCLKAAGAGYWNKIRVDFPDVFERRSKQEEMINVALVKISANKIRKYWPEVFEQMKVDGYEPKIDVRNTMRIPLRYLPKDAGNHKDMDIGACGFFCEKPGDNYNLDL
ncbi:phosphoadenosine phosphosulfate reductase [Pseudoalteromonas phage PHS3]|nr:phosphoadenosine phosphosulfate reductase [Pseudoalteromonas phage PHS3]